MDGTKKTGLGKGIAILRIALGGGFLFAGLDKALDFGGTGTAFSAAGFLKGATGGAWLSSDPKTIVNPTHDFWVGLAGNASLVSVINTLVVFGEIAIGVALILGFANRFASYAAVLMMALFYIANWSFATGPFNEQFMYGLTALVLAIVGAGEYYGLDAIIDRSEAVRKAPALRYVLA
jgi:thiosulfate dehydrogenase [quinone] large subunit